MAEIEINGSKVNIDGEVVSLPGDVADIIEFDNLIVIRYETEGKDPDSDNIWAIDYDGHLVWKAQPVEAPTNDVNTYVKIRAVKGELLASDWKGMEYKLNLDSGNPIESTFRK
jgi:outer membrane protein assembly factor BamB